MKFKKLFLFALLSVLSFAGAYAQPYRAYTPTVGATIYPKYYDAIPCPPGEYIYDTYFGPVLTAGSGTKADFINVMSKVVSVNTTPDSYGVYWVRLMIVSYDTWPATTYYINWPWRYNGDYPGQGIRYFTSPNMIPW